MAELKLKAEDLYKKIVPYRMSRKCDCPGSVQFILMINRWVNPHHALQDLEKVIPFKRRKQLEQEVIITRMK